MNKVLISWTLPLMVSLILVVFIKIFYLHVYVVKDDCMKNTLKKNDKLVCLSSKNIIRNDIVLVNHINRTEFQFRRIIAIPGDTVMLKRSIVYVNNQRFNDNSTVNFTYSFTTDNIVYACKLLNKNKIIFDSTLASIGVFKFDADLQKLKLIKTDSLKFNVKRMVDNPNISIHKAMNLNPSSYWNKDNLGPVIVPGKGLKVKIDEKVLELYKEIIEKESGKKVRINDNKIYLSKLPLDFYTFKQDYYFLLNDNRNIQTDSRNTGFVSKDKIISKLWFKLPW